MVDVALLDDEMLDIGIARNVKGLEELRKLGLTYLVRASMDNEWKYTAPNTGWMDGWIGGWMDQWMDGRTDGRMGV